MNFKLLLAPCALLLLGASPAPTLTLAPLAAVAGDTPPAPWHVAGLPQQTKPFTRFSVVSLDGQRVLKVEADSSYGNLVHPLHEDTGAPHRLSWRWRVDEPNPQSDLTRRAGDDSPVKVCALYDLPLQLVPFVERQVLRVARMRSGEVLPAASVCYVWDAHLAAGAVLDNAFTRRIRFIVLQGPNAPLHQWQHEQRNIDADFLRLFGDETHTVPPLLGIAVGADADNTRTHSVAHVADVMLD
ncbi:DUF3047 domain-containing protein [Aquabacterium sp.]|uniref:DUF3047 domain-containing protein n=1 Tax=Aquabacterium sp. TaxID=1872578 RepID=UPI003784545C